MIAQHEHDVLRRGLDPEEDSNPDTGMTVGVKVQFLRNARRGMMALDPVDTPDIIRTLERYLREYDSSEEDFTTICPTESRMQAIGALFKSFEDVT